MLLHLKNSYSIKQCETVFWMVFYNLFKWVYIECIKMEKKRMYDFLSVTIFSHLSLSLVTRTLHVNCVAILYFGFGKVLLWR